MVKTIWNDDGTNGPVLICLPPKRDMSATLEAFRATLEAQQLAGLAPRGVDCESNRTHCLCTIKVGRKYANVDVGRSGKYMVVIDTGEIYGIKAYGVIHRGHYFGTLDTIHEWDWSDYAARKRKQVA